MKSLVKFKHIHTDQFHPDGLETEFVGFASIIEDENGLIEAVNIEQLYANGVEVACFPSNRAKGFISTEWSRFLSIMEEAVWSCNNTADQSRISLPKGSLYYKQSASPLRSNMDAIKEAMPGASGIVVVTAGNARELPDFDFVTYEIIEQ